MTHTATHAHTPGPWTVKNRTSVMAGESQIAFAGFKGGDWPQEDFEREAANARLIAAAPALLAALRDLLKCVDCQNPIGPDGKSLMFWSGSPAQDAARAAITLAEPRHAAERTA
jgi:hypothetical protein